MKPNAAHAIAGIVVGCSLMAGCGASQSVSKPIPSPTTQCKQFETDAKLVMKELKIAPEEKKNFFTLQLDYLIVNANSECISPRILAIAQASIANILKNR